MKAEKHLETWAAQGLISKEQVQAILKFEAQTPQRSWALFGIAGVGITAIVAGIVSLLAANWDAISPTTKISIYFAAQSALGIGFLCARDRRDLRREVLLTLFGLMFLAGIGLVGQIFNLESDGYSGIFFWCALALPIALLAQSRMLPELWTIGFLTALAIWVFSQVNDHHGYDSLLRGVSWVISIYALTLVRREEFLLPEYFRRAAQRWTFLSLAAISVLANSFWYSTYNEVQGVQEGHICLLSALVLLLAVMSFSRPKFPARLRVCLGASFSLLVAYLALPWLLGLGEREVLGALGFVLVWSFAAAAAVFADRKRLFDFATLAIAVRFVVVYFEVFGSLAATGIGLILSGLVILGIALVWHRYRRSIAVALGAG